MVDSIGYRPDLQARLGFNKVSIHYPVNIPGYPIWLVSTPLKNDGLRQLG